MYVGAEKLIFEGEIFAYFFTFAGLYLILELECSEIAWSWDGKAIVLRGDGLRRLGQGGLGWICLSDLLWI